MERILALMTPNAITEEEGPQVGISKGKRQRDGVPQVCQRLVGLDLAPHRARPTNKPSAPDRTRVAETATHGHCVSRTRVH